MTQEAKEAAEVVETRPGFFASYTMRCAVHGDGCVKVQGTWHCPRCRAAKEASGE